ncbi:MAG: hypothetical protein ACFB4I_13300 [Cyanophyceae cyanobacterium]
MAKRRGDYPSWPDKSQGRAIAVDDGAASCSSEFLVPVEERCLCYGAV